jgi:hypothetical protein
MSRNGFLDTGVVIAFCFLLDSHHQNCKEYLGEMQEEGDSLYVSSEVEEEYSRKKSEIAEKLSEQVLEHRDFVTGFVDGRQMGPVEINEIQKNLRRWDEDASTFLIDYYDKKGNFAGKEEVLEELRNLSREIEKKAIERKSAVDSATVEWEKRDEYPELRSLLSVIHGSDRDICIMAHDLACHADGQTEFATTNPRDFVDDGRERLILENTEIDRVVDLAQR